jgi:hypothetical protein
MGGEKGERRKCEATARADFAKPSQRHVGFEDNVFHPPRSLYSFSLLDIAASIHFSFEIALF